MTQQLAVRADVTPAQFDQDIEAAQHKAKSLKHIVDSQGLSIRIGNSEHLKVEAWLTIAAGYGFSPRIAWSRPLPDGGYEAHAELVDSMGTVIGAGEAECGTAGDDNWLGKPAFQQRSMAQTRATVRACRNKLAWVVILAGYSPTPAEEMVEGQKPMQDNRYQCPVHNTQWFKRGNMKGYAHPIEGKGTWCNMKDAPLDIFPDAQDVAPVTQGEAPAASAATTAPAASQTPLPKASQEFKTARDVWEAIEKEAERHGIDPAVAVEGVQKAIGPLGEHMGKGYTRGQYYDLAVAALKAKALQS